MAEIVTTLTGFEVKNFDTGVLTKFAAEDGKKYQTWDEELAEVLKGRIGQQSYLVFEVQSRTSGGRTYTNNVVSEGGDPANRNAGLNGSGGAARSAVLERLTALDIGERILSTLIGSGQAEESDYSLDGIGRVALGVLAWAEQEAPGEDPEDALPPASESVPD